MPAPLCATCQDAEVVLLEDGSQVCPACDTCDACGKQPVVLVRRKLRWCNACRVEHFGLADVVAVRLVRGPGPN